MLYAAVHNSLYFLKKSLIGFYHLHLSIIHNLEALNMTTCKETQRDLDWANNIGFRSLLHIHTHMSVSELDLESNTYFLECVLN